MVGTGSKGKCRVLAMGRNSPSHQYVQGDDHSEGRKGAGVLVDIKMNMSWQMSRCGKDVKLCPELH